MMAVRAKLEKSHLQSTIVNRLLVDVSKFSVYVLSVSNAGKKWPSCSVMADVEKKNSQPSHAENKLFIGKGVSFSVDVARVWLEVKALFTKE